MEGREIALLQFHRFCHQGQRGFHVRELALHAPADRLRILGGICAQGPELRSFKLKQQKDHECQQGQGREDRHRDEIGTNRSCGEKAQEHSQEAAHHPALPLQRCDWPILLSNQLARSALERGYRERSFR